MHTNYLQFMVYCVIHCNGEFSENVELFFVLEELRFFTERATSLAFVVLDELVKIIEGRSEVELNVVIVIFTTDVGARFSFHCTILKMPGASKLVSFLAKGVTGSLDALFLTRFGSQRAEY
ncbi:peptide methionine sulfoxide reductase of unknown function DUF829 [Perilla frutescens var. frutescens]|nr:peptide methionine sulfoxide reductase of unknown function DUF829 [Perilla frutescens var. frutescens]